MNIAKIITYGRYFSVPKFINFITHVGKNLIFIRQALVLFFCMRDPDTPKYVKAVIIGALGYLVLPADIVPDAIMGLGWLDDLAVLTVATKFARKYIKPSHYKLAKQKFPFGDEERLIK